MGIQSWIEDSKIKIKKEDLEKLKIDINEFLSDNTPDFQPLELNELILEFGFGTKYNENGDLINIFVDCEKTYNEEYLMALLAPFAENGSFIKLGVSGEAGDCGDLFLKYTFRHGKLEVEDNLPSFKVKASDVVVLKDMPKELKITDWSAVYTKKYFEIDTDSFKKLMNDLDLEFFLYTDNYRSNLKTSILSCTIATVKKGFFDQNEIDELSKGKKIVSGLIESIESRTTVSTGKNFDYPSWLYCEHEMEWEVEKATLPTDIGDFLEKAKVQIDIYGGSIELHSAVLQSIISIVPECIFTTDGDNYFKNKQ